MLDYAQLSAGQFRKFYSKFNLVESVNEIKSIMQYKADELGITLKVNIESQI